MQTKGSTRLRCGRELELTVPEPDFRNVHSVNLDPAFRSLKDTEQCEQERRLPAPRPPANADLFLRVLKCSVSAGARASHNDPTYDGDVNVFQHQFQLRPVFRGVVTEVLQIIASTSSEFALTQT